jgi:hypothetical protein
MHYETVHNGSEEWSCILQYTFQWLINCKHQEFQALVDIPRCHQVDDECGDEPYNVHIKHARDDQEDAWKEPMFKRHIEA